MRSMVFTVRVVSFLVRLSVRLLEARIPYPFRHIRLALAPGSFALGLAADLLGWAIA